MQSRRDSCFLTSHHVQGSGLLPYGFSSKGLAVTGIPLVCFIPQVKAQDHLVISALWNTIGQLLSAPAEEAATFIRCEASTYRDASVAGHNRSCAACKRWHGRISKSAITPIFALK
jgi:hypothetical protein